MGGGAANGSMASAPRVLAEATCSHTGRPKGTAANHPGKAALGDCSDAHGGGTDGFDVRPVSMRSLPRPFSSPCLA